MIRNERGMALALVIFALATMSVLIAGVFYLTFSELRSGRGAKGSAQAQAVAEQGAEAILANWNATTYNAMTNGQTLTLATVDLGSGQTYAPTIRRLSNSMFLITSDGRITRGGRVVARAQVGLLARVDKLDLSVHAAITVLNGISVSGNANIDGTDHIPNSAWSGMCPATGAGMPGIAWGGTTAPATSGGCSSASCITGNPPIYHDSTVTPATFTNFGSLTYAELVAMATRNYSGGTTLTNLGPSYIAGPPQTCNRTDDNNWGAPLGPNTNVCFNYFPIIHSSGNMHISGGQGQGILLVDGDLQLSGGVEFFGLVIVLGGVTSTGTGGHIWGSVQAAQADLTISSVSGNSVVNYSACSIQRAIANTAITTAAGDRRWAMLY